MPYVFWNPISRYPPSSLPTQYRRYRYRSQVLFCEIAHQYIGGINIVLQSFTSSVTSPCCCSGKNRDLYLIINLSVRVFFLGKEIEAKDASFQVFTNKNVILSYKIYVVYYTLVSILRSLTGQTNQTIAIHAKKIVIPTFSGRMS